MNPTGGSWQCPAAVALLPACELSELRSLLGWVRSLAVFWLLLASFGAAALGLRQRGTLRGQLSGRVQAVLAVIGVAMAAVALLVRTDAVPFAIALAGFGIGFAGIAARERGSAPTGAGVVAGLGTVAIASASLRLWLGLDIARASGFRPVDANAVHATVLARLDELAALPALVGISAMALLASLLIATHGASLRRFLLGAATVLVPAAIGFAAFLTAWLPTREAEFGAVVRPVLIEEPIVPTSSAWNGVSGDVVISVSASGLVRARGNLYTSRYRDLEQAPLRLGAPDLAELLRAEAERQHEDAILRYSGTVLAVDRTHPSSVLLGLAGEPALRPASIGVVRRVDAVRVVGVPFEVVSQPHELSVWARPHGLEVRTAGGVVTLPARDAELASRAWAAARRAELAGDYGAASAHLETAAAEFDWAGVSTVLDQAAEEHDDAWAPLSIVLAPEVPVDFVGRILETIPRSGPVSRAADPTGWSWSSLYGGESRWGAVAAQTVFKIALVVPESGSAR